MEKESMNEKKGKNIIIILLIIIIIMLITLLVLLLTGKINYKDNTNNNEPTNYVVDNKNNFINNLIGEWGMCQENYGCHGINISKNGDNKYTFAPYQMWSDGGYAGVIETIKKNNDNKYTLTVHFDAVDNMLTTVEEHTNKYVIDISDVNSNTIVVDNYTYKRINGDREKFFNSLKDNKYTIQGLTTAKIDLFWTSHEYEFKITNGQLYVDNETYSIPNEKIKYFYFRRYQCSHSTVIHYLTENGNIYVTELKSNDSDIKVLNNFKKLNYSNVSDIAVIPNENYGKPMDNVSGITDNKVDFLYAIIDGKEYQLDYQYRC